jgi:hypothetical protein
VPPKNVAVPDPVPRRADHLVSPTAAGPILAVALGKYKCVAGVYRAADADTCHARRSATWLPARVRLMAGNTPEYPADSTG